MDLAGNVRRGPGPNKGKTKKEGCHCAPVFTKIERKLDKDKRTLMKAIDASHARIDSRLLNLEKRTRDQIFNLNQAMKESFAQERGECLDRMDRRALRYQMKTS